MKRVITVGNLWGLGARGRCRAVERAVKSEEVLLNGELMAARPQRWSMAGPNNNNSSGGSQGSWTSPGARPGHVQPRLCSRDVLVICHSRVSRRPASVHKASVYPLKRVGTDDLLQTTFPQIIFHSIPTREKACEAATLISFRKTRVSTAVKFLRRNPS